MDPDIIIIGIIPIVYSMGRVFGLQGGILLVRMEGARSFTSELCCTCPNSALASAGAAFFPLLLLVSYCYTSSTGGSCQQSMINAHSLSFSCENMPAPIMLSMFSTVWYITVLNRGLGKIKV